MRRDVLRVAGFFVGAAALVAAVLAWAPRLFQAAAGPDAQVIAALKRQEALGLSVPILAGSPPLVTRQLHFDRIAVEVDERDPHRADAVFTLDVSGQLGTVTMSALGLERTAMRWEAGTWVPVDGWVPSLRRGLAALEARRRGLASKDREALARLVPPAQRASALADPALLALLVGPARYEVLSWYVRNEREELLVSEEYQWTGPRPPQVLDAKGGRRLRLRREGEEFLFAEGLM